MCLDSLFLNFNYLIIIMEFVIHSICEISNMKTKPPTTVVQSSYFGLASFIFSNISSLFIPLLFIHLRNYLFVNIHAHFRFLLNRSGCNSFIYLAYYQPPNIFLPIVFLHFPFCSLYSILVPSIGFRM